MMISFVLHSHFHFPPSSLLSVSLSLCPSLVLSFSLAHTVCLFLLPSRSAFVCNCSCRCRCRCRCGMRHVAFCAPFLFMECSYSTPRLCHAPLPASLLLLLVSPVRGACFSLANYVCYPFAHFACHNNSHVARPGRQAATSPFPFPLPFLVLSPLPPPFPSPSLSLCHFHFHLYLGVNVSTFSIFCVQA